MERVPVELSLSDYGQLGSLENYVRLAAPEVELTRVPGRPGSGEQGALDVLTVLADSSVLVALVKVLPEFLRSRRSGMSVDMKLPGKGRITVTADNAEDAMAAIEKFLDAGS
jgi:membrane-associated two-gene conflict system component 1 (EACC1)